MSSLQRSSRRWVLSLMAAAIGLAAASGVVAAEASDNDLLDFESEAIVVTATKEKQETKDIPASVSVITRAEIERSNATNLVDLLVREPGVFVVRQGGMGFAGNVRIRGLGGSPPTQVTVLIDGHPDFMGVMGHILPSAYLLDNVQRIEIVRGPASTLYGSMAMGGVINIITRGADADQVSRLSGTAGTFNTRGSTLQMGGRRGERNWLLATGTSCTDGSHPYGFYDEKNFSLRVNGPVARGVTASFSAQAVVYDTLDQRTVAQSGGVFPPIDSLRQHFDRRDYDLTFDLDRGGAKTSVKLFRNDGDHSFADGWHSDDFVEGIGLTHRRTGARSGLLWGLDLHRYGGDILSPVPLRRDFERDEHALYLTADRILGDGGRVQAGLRWHDAEGFGSKLLPQLGYTRPVGADTAVRASVRRGYRVPSFRELFVFPLSRNPDLVPEDVWQYEIGASRTLGKGLLDLALFALRGSNLILIDPGTGRFDNTGSVRYRGVEIGYRRAISAHSSAYANYSYLHAGDAKDGTVGHKAAAGVDYAAGKWRWSLDGLLADRLYGTKQIGGTPTLVRVGGYFVANAKVGYQINDVYQATLGVENLLDKQYQVDPAYPFDMPGRAFVFGLNSRF